MPDIASTAGPVVMILAIAALLIALVVLALLVLVLVGIRDHSIEKVRDKDVPQTPPNEALVTGQQLGTRAAPGDVSAR